MEKENKYNELYLRILARRNRIQFRMKAFIFINFINLIIFIVSFCYKDIYNELIASSFFFVILIFYIFEYHDLNEHNDMLKSME